MFDLKVNLQSTVIIECIVAELAFELSLFRQMNLQVSVKPLLSRSSETTTNQDNILNFLGPCTFFMWFA